MRAVVHDRYGPPPEVLRVAEVERPVPKEHEVLVKIHASTVTRSDAIACATSSSGSPSVHRHPPPEADDLRLGVRGPCRGRLCANNDKLAGSVRTRLARRSSPPSAIATSQKSRCTSNPKKRINTTSLWLTTDRDEAGDATTTDPCARHTRTVAGRPVGAGNSDLEITDREPCLRASKRFRKRISSAGSATRSSLR
jgi:hypothetical protein